MKKLLIFIILILINFTTINAQTLDSIQYSINDTVKWKQIFENNTQYFYAADTLIGYWVYENNKKYNYNNKSELIFHTERIGNYEYAYSIDSLGESELEWVYTYFYSGIPTVTIPSNSDKVICLRHDNIIRIYSYNVIEKIEVFSISGMLINTYFPNDKTAFINPKDTHIIILKIITDNMVYIKKM